MRTSNPTLNDEVFANAPALAGGQVMTLQGTVNKTFILALLLVISGGFSWQFVQANPQISGLLSIGSALVGFVLVLASSFKPTWSPVIAPAYGVVEGVFVGVVSSRYAGLYSGIVLQAALLTLGILFALLFAYQSRLIKATENLKLGIVAATGGIAIVYLVSIALSFFGIQIPLIHQSGLVGIGFSLVVVVIAALNLVLDFDFIENGVSHGAPKYMEWQGALGLLVTIVWLYIEMLRLLSKLRSRD
ncbi:MAG: Bax inhibitor-1/YccA family protein [Verrucomicrobia bacterium]|nr:Bax inhibitor-1/YccA family protein [Verrucomicrobiota bacterium]